MQEQNSLKKKTISGMFWSFSDLISNQGIQFVIQVILARLLAPKDFGVIGMITVFIAISQSFIDSGFTNALIREKEPSQEDYSTVFYFNLSMAIVMYAILFFSAGAISRFFKETQLIAILRVLAVVLIINSFGLIQRTMLTKNINFKIQTKISVISSIISGIIGIMFAYIGFGVWSLVIKTLVMQLIQSLLLCMYNRWIPSLVFRINSFKNFFEFGWKILASGLIDTLYNNLYFIVIGKVFSTVDLGYYTNAQKLRDTASQSISGSVQKVSYPVLSCIKEDEDRLREGYKKIISTSVYITFPLMIGLAAVAEPIFVLIFGPKWINSIEYFQVLCFSGMLYPLHAINLGILQVKGRSDLFLRLEIIKKVIGLLSIVIVMFFKLGIMGMVWALVFTSFIAYFINSYYSAELLHYSTMQQIKDVAPAFIATIVMGIIVYFSEGILPRSNLVKLIVQIIIGVAVYVTESKIGKIKEFNTVYEVLGSISKEVKIKLREEMQIVKDMIANTFSLQAKRKIEIERNEELIKLEMGDVNKMAIQVTKPSMPKFEEFTEEIKVLWKSCWLTNMGEKHKKLEALLLKYLNTPNITLYTNGHLALECVIAAFDLKGEVITTPFTFASTTHAIVRNGLEPVFCDINPFDYTIDVEKLESLITDKTSAIIPVHVYGNICNFKEIERIAKKYNLKVIYDAAHAFGVTLDGVSVANFGDASMFSFHATKVFNTIEGGAVTYKDENLSKILYDIKNFGITGPESVEYVGGNAKMNEFQAAMGLCNLRHINAEIEKRKKVVEIYRERLGGIKGIKLVQPQDGINSNYAYFPIVLYSFGLNRDELTEVLKNENIFVRKYFYPLTNSFECYKNRFDCTKTPIAKYISDRVLTLPLYADLTLAEVDRICDIILMNRV